MFATIVYAVVTTGLLFSFYMCFKLKTLEELLAYEAKLKYIVSRPLVAFGLIGLSLYAATTQPWYVVILVFLSSGSLNMFTGGKRSWLAEQKKDQASK